MKFPKPCDYIDIHTHGGKPAPHIFSIENLMAHELIDPEDIYGQICSFGIHPWFLSENNIELLLNRIKKVADQPNMIAVGEAGFDKLKGPSLEIQRTAFEEQVSIAEKIEKPVVIHCVRAWDDLLAEHKRLQPKMPWLVHGFRGNIRLAEQLLSKGMYLSFWFEYIIRPESSNLLKLLPLNRIFLETDGADIDIKYIYDKVSIYLGITVDELKKTILSNYKEFFNQKEVI